MAFEVKYKIGNRYVTEAEFRRARRTRAVTIKPGAPMLAGMTRRPSQTIISESLAVHPKDAAAAEAAAKKHGLNVHFRPDGRPEFANTNQMGQYAKTQGMHHVRKRKKQFYAQL